MWDREFIKRLCRMSAPIILQNLFAVLSSSATTLMTGQLGDTAIASAGLLNQFFYLLTLVQFGLSTGCAIFTAQFWGSGDKSSVHKTLGVSLLLGALAGALFTGIALAVPELFLRVFTRDAEVLSTASELLRIAGVSFLFTPVTYTYAYIHRTTGESKLPMLASILGVVITLILGYGLIFGKFGFPNLGVRGAAVANLVSRVLECILLVWLTYWFKTPLAVSLHEIFAFEGHFFRRVVRRVLPVMLNEFIWGLGITTYSAIYARLGTEAYAAVSIKDSIDSLLFAPFLGITNACAVLVGNTIGAGKPEKAQDYVRQTLLFVAAIAIVSGAGLVLVRQPLINTFNISDQSRALGLQLLIVLGVTLCLRACNLEFFIGMMRSGGNTRFAYVMDVGSMWAIGVPLALLGAFVFHLPIHQVYMLVMVEEAIKFVVSFWRFRSRRWIHDLFAV